MKEITERVEKLMAASVRTEARIVVEHRKLAQASAVGGGTASTAWIDLRGSDRVWIEQDDAWEKELKGIDPDLSADHWPENFSVKRLKQWARGKYVKAFGVVLGHYRLARPLRNMLKTVYQKLGSLLGHS
jgi:hypothetical protein